MHDWFPRALSSYLTVSLGVNEVATTFQITLDRNGRHDPIYICERTTLLRNPRVPVPPSADHVTLTRQWIGSGGS